MKPGSIGLAHIQQSDGRFKQRPVVVLQEMPPFSDFLICAISSQLRHQSPEFDEVINNTDSDFATSGLKVTSLIRLGLLATLPRTALLGELGTISEQRLARLRVQLARHIRG
ncbi:MAG: type II toxin-antitoxin system PemK/MazF family toxin [Verrucomicrobiota bacterium]|nr:type II toxin-antitoxin system PemK/MazF family toxin [Verrucomicrobiota bacterium]